MDDFSIEYALLCMQNALQDAVTPELRAVVMDVNKDEESLYIRMYYDGNISDDLIDQYDCAITECSAHYVPDTISDYGVERLDYPQKIPVRGRLAYLRKEPGLSFPSQPKIEMKEFHVAYALLAVGQALLGKVTPELRAVVVDASEEEKLLYVHFYYDGAVSEDLIELWKSAIAEAKTDFGFDCMLDSGVERFDFPSQEFPFRGRYAYIRKE